MQRPKRKLVHPLHILKNSRGQTLIEYGLILILIAVVVVAAVTLVGQRTSTAYSKVTSALPDP